MSDVLHSNSLVSPFFRIDPLEPLATLGSHHTAFISPGETSTVRVINTLTGDGEPDLRLDTVTEVPVTADIVGEVLVLGYRDRITLWDLLTSKLISRIHLCLFGVTSSLVAMCANETTVAAIVSGGTLCLWSFIDILRTYVKKLSVKSVRFRLIETKDLPWKNKIELKDLKVVFGSEKNLGDFCMISSSYLDI